MPVCLNSEHAFSACPQGPPGRPGPVGPMGPVGAPGRPVSTCVPAYSQALVRPPCRCFSFNCQMQPKVPQNSCDEWSLWRALRHNRPAFAYNFAAVKTEEEGFKTGGHQHTANQDKFGFRSGPSSHASTLPPHTYPHDERPVIPGKA